jgi:hypothetical protein
MAARSELAHDQAECEKALRLLFQRYRNRKCMPGPLPTPADVCIFRLTLTVISLLDYSKGFGHADLVTC